MSSNSAAEHRQQTIWVHSEAFGYGPSAIAFTILPKLRYLRASSGAGLSLEYIGHGHTLELNTSPPWDNVHVCNISDTNGKKLLRHLIDVHRPSIIISVVDEPFAAYVSTLKSVKLIVMDPILWYWPSIPDAWRAATKLIALDYVGVRKRVHEDHLQNAVVVPPLVPTRSGSAFIGPKKGTLVNLGGLQNPFVSFADNVAYARLVVSAIKTAIATRSRPEDHPLQCLVTQELSTNLDMECVTSTTPDHVRTLLAQCETAFLTSGLANMCDAADCGGRVIFLPPTNQTQGMQPKLLEEELGCSIARIDWHEANVTMAKVDYVSAGEEDCFSLIQRQQNALINDNQAQQRFLQLIITSFEVPNHSSKMLGKLFPAFGRDDGTLVASAIAGADAGFTLQNPPASLSPSTR
ncbi:hypothetical protein QQS21_012404 [Conoideocrella luteorostrata]|uniref:Uncharacterized protein n=1 Tax=Conoideocrella luteorostrata TaxID=1105319 RepID=A0AAJ0CB85_9HYPO|nr:hypothetical protein QQS21_012404 [Conoideocrella luteorostrata]